MMDVLNAPALAEMVARGLVRAKGRVCINYGGGLATFARDMAAAGFLGELVEVEHYSVDRRAPGANFGASYSGLVTFIGDVPIKVLQEIAGIIEERGSHPFYEHDNMCVLNNPLFRAVVGMGVWETPVAASSASQHAPGLLDTLVAEVAAARLNRMQEEKAALVSLINKKMVMANAMGHGGFSAMVVDGLRVSASDNVKALSAARRRLKALEAVQVEAN